MNHIPRDRARPGGALESSCSTSACGMAHALRSSERQQRCIPGIPVFGASVTHAVQGRRSEGSRAAKPGVLVVMELRAAERQAEPVLAFVCTRPVAIAHIGIGEGFDRRIDGMR